MSSPFTDQFWRAIADYKVFMPALGTAAATWLTEYNKVRRTAFASVMFTANSTEGGSASGQRQFPQEVLTDALHCHRHDLDPAYALPVHLSDYESAKIQRARAGNRRGMTLRFGA